MNDGIKNLVTSGRLHKIIRGEEFSFKTPPQINAEMQPTDHNEFLSRAIYSLCPGMGIDYMLRALENGLKDAATDAIGVYCAVQCYYVQIMSEKYGESPFKIDRVNLPLFLGKQFRKHECGFLAVKLNKLYPPDTPLRRTLGAIEILQTNEGICFEEPH